jgi:hypothetical protein
MYDEHKHDIERIARLRTLVVRLERLPQSHARDQLLRKARHRSVMLDTGPPSTVWGAGPDDERVARLLDLPLPAVPRTRSPFH